MAQEYFGDEQHPDLYLNCCSREHTGLFGVGFIETNSGAYHLFDRQAHLLAAFIDEQRTGTASAREFDRLRRMDYPDLSGGLRFDSSPRHRGYVDADAYRRCNAPSVRILLDAIGSLENGGPDRRRHYGGACDQRLNGFRAHSQQVERSS